MTTTLQLGSQCNKQKREGKDPPSVNKDETERILRKQVPVNYRKLDNPFSDEEDLDETHQTPPQRREAYVKSRVTSFLELVKLLTLPSDWQNL
jgi:hypothetical protein